MPGTPVQEFTMLMNQTPSLFLSDPQNIVNLAQERTTLLKRMIGSSSAKEMMVGTPTMRDTVYTERTGTIEFYKPGDPSSYVNAQAGREISLGWRFARKAMVWTDAEIMLQATSGMQAGARAAVYKSVRRTKEIDFASQWVTGIENALLASPHNQQAEMEDATGTRPYSIFAFVNEEANGTPAGWTTVMGLNRASVAGWRPYQATYNKNDIGGLTGNARGLLDAMHDAVRKCTYEDPGIFDGNFNASKLSRRVFIMSDIGLKKYENLLLTRNDRLRAVDDPAVMNPRFAGIPTLYIAGLDTAAIYTTGSGRTTEEGSGVTHAGPRAYLLNFDCLRIKFFQGKFFDKRPAITLPNQQDTHVQETDTWLCTYCRKPNELAVISPAAA